MHRLSAVVTVFNFFSKYIALKMKLTENYVRARIKAIRPNNKPKSQNTKQASSI